MAPVGMKGPIQPGVVPEVLRSIYLGRRTGLGPLPARPPRPRLRSRAPRGGAGGTLYRRRGLSTRAASMFRRALEVDPAHRAALAEMDALEKAPPAPAPARRPPRRT